ncbi:MAG: hypothetical protein AB1298_00490 [Bacteroidota bacterium]
MYLENARALGQGIMLLIFAAIANWINITVGLALVALMGLLILQSAFTDRCPSDPIWRLMKFRKKLEDRK